MASSDEWQQRQLFEKEIKWTTMQPYFNPKVYKVTGGEPPKILVDENGSWRYEKKN